MATNSGGPYFTVLTVRLPDICLFVADGFHWTGHYRLWCAGIHHRDISAFNLMYKREHDKIVGVLNDFDLAIIKHDKRENTERTGTMLFMALDLLEDIIAKSNQVHLYRYDAESFLWVAIWVCGTFEGSGPRRNAPFKAWTQEDARHCIDTRHSFATRASRDEENIWSEGHQARADILQEIRFQLDDDEINRRRQRKASKDNGVVQLEEPDCPQTHYDRISGTLFSALRREVLK